jgi:hypothetical protein
VKQLHELETLEDLKSLIDLNISNEGDDLTFIYYDRIKSSRPDKNITHNINITHNNWHNTFNLCIEALNLSKDLNIAFWMLEALVYEKNLLGFYIGIGFIAELIEKYPNIFPKDMESKFNCFDWMNNHILEWLENEIILEKDGKFPILYIDIYNNKFNKDILKKYIYNKDYAKQKLDLMENIKNILTNMNDFSFYFSSILTFYFKVKIFYENCESYLVNVENNKKNDINKDLNENNNVDLNSKEEIFKEIGKLATEGLKLDKNDVLLYLIYKIFLLKNKPVNQIINLIRENDLSKLLE